MDLVAQTVKNLPAMQETWVWSLGWEDPLEEDMATHSSILAWRVPMDRGAWRATVPGVTESDMTEWLSPTQEDETTVKRQIFWFTEVGAGPCLPSLIHIKKKKKE